MKKHTIRFSLSLLCCLVALPLTGIAQESAATGSSPRVLPDKTMVVDWAAVSTLNLETAVEIALAGNPGLEAAAARVRQAKDQVDQARSTYWPRLDANASGARVAVAENTYQQNLAAARLLNPAATIDDPLEYYTADLTASWTLFDGFERKFSNASARYGEQSSTAALNDARRLLISAVALSYFSAQLALENISIAKADEEFNQGQLADAEARQRVGTGSLSDVLNFQVRKNQAKTTRINQEYQLEIALYGLAALLGLPDSRLPAHVTLGRLSLETAPELSSLPVDELIAKAMDHRPDIQQVQWSIKQTEAQVKIAQSDYYPSVVLAGSLDGERVDDPGFGEDDFGNRVQVGLSYNLFAGGFTRARVREVRHRRVELEKRLEELVLSVTSDIRSSVALVTTAQTQVALQRENVDLVQRTRDLVEKEYNAGQASLVRLNESQKDLTTAQSNLALALVALRQAWVELETRTGNVLVTYENAGR
ncbi:TolC family protein [Desulfosarcina sp.]|uniref:TolC family protein n=1 Tax=Desulfosarcina sp. TaxID=2027861 RepID=UPI0029B4F29C|nr:TolC family protein [Desulfosarcina sp.]MDX2451200.1 TolC family protein [Desulfosarcina sp.]MDX2489030.1 TolC family protein [Desulfosarcina sp.]